MAAAVNKAGISLGQFLMAEDINQIGMIAFNLRQLDSHDLTLVRKVLEENWEDEEQMVSNLLQYPFLIPDDIRMQSLKRGLNDVECPYYILSSAVGLQRLNPLENNRLLDLMGELKKACLHDIGIVAMQAFMTLHPLLKYPEDRDFIADILKQPRSTLFHNALTWLLIKVKDKDLIIQLLNEKDVTADVKFKAERFLDDQLKTNNNGEEPSLLLQFVNYVPCLNDFEAMLDKQDTLSDFFLDLDGDNDGKVSLRDVQNFLEDIGKVVSLDELKKDAQSNDVNDTIDKDTFIEIMFPRFQMK